MAFHFDYEKEYSWTGDFWYSDIDPEIKSNHFGGMLTYAPDKGFQLHIITDAQLPEKREHLTQYIHGVVPDLNKVSLMNCIVNPGVTHYGDVSYSTISFRAQYLIKGIWVKNTDMNFTGVSFHCPLLDPFFDRRHNFHCVRCEENLLDVDLVGELNMKVFHGYAKNNIFIGKLFSRGEQFREKCEQLNEVMGDDDMTLTKAYPIIKITGDRKTANDYLKIHHKIRVFFATLILMATYADKTWLIAGDESYEVLAHMPKSHKLPENMGWNTLTNTIESIKDNFKDLYEEFRQLMDDGGLSLLNILIHERIFKHRNQIDSVGYLQYCWIINTIGDWQCKHGARIDPDSGKPLSGKEVANRRFELFLKQHLRPQNEFRTAVKNELSRVLGASDLTVIGSTIGGIRDCLEHKNTSSSYPTYKNFVEDEICVNNLCELLFLLLMSALYDKLGIKLNDRQNLSLKQKIIKWSKYF